jgi:sugar-specific transcriptional regulator TrmB
MINIEMLENLGLTKSEIKVYLCLLELNSAAATEIAEKADIYRKNAYDALNRLIKKGLVSSAKVETKRMFSAANPLKLLEFLEVRKSEIQSMLPELKAIYKAVPIMDNVTVFKGKEGLKTIFEDVIKSKIHYDTFGSGEKFKEYLPYYYLQYQKKKEFNKIKCRAIYSENERQKDFVKEFIGEKKFLPKEFVNPASTTIYGNKVAIIAWKENPFGILINSKEVAESYRYYFESLWQNAK